MTSGTSLGSATGGEGWGRGCDRRGRLLREQRRGEPANEAAGGLASIRDPVARVLQPLLGGVLELGGDDRSLGEAERPGGATQPMGVAAQCFDCGHVVARSDQPFSQLCDRSELITGSLQVLV